MIDTTPIGADEMRALEQLHHRLPALRKIPFAVVLTTPYLIGPLRRTLEAQQLAARDFELTPPPTPGRNPGNAPSSPRTSSSSESSTTQRAAAPHRRHAA